MAAKHAFLSTRQSPSRRSQSVWVWTWPSSAKTSQDPTLREKVGHDHEEAVSRGVFGTPTYVFEGGRVAFLKAFAPPAEDAVSEFEHFVAIASHRNYIGELKRPQPPWPKGALD